MACQVKVQAKAAVLGWVNTLRGRLLPSPRDTKGPLGKVVRRVKITVVEAVDTSGLRIRMEVWFDKVVLYVMAQGEIMTNNTFCAWQKDGHNFEDHKYWETDCGNLFQFAIGGPEQNHYKFCPYCGKLIKEVVDEKV